MDEENDWLEFIKMPNIYKLNFEEGYCDDISNFSETVSEPIKHTQLTISTVSYTHLTLPTILRV